PRRGQGRGRSRSGRDRDRAPRRGRRHGQGHRPQRQRRQGAPDAAEGHRRARRRTDLARDPLSVTNAEPATSAVTREEPTEAGGGAPRRHPPEVSNRLVVALVRGVHGLRGAVRVEILTDRPEQRYAVGSVLHREGQADPLTVAWSSAVADGPGWRLRFAEVPDRSAAEGLMGAYLEIAAGPDASLPRGS